MVAASVMEIGIDDEVVGVAPEVEDRLAAYFADVASGLVRSEQRRNAELYARGLMRRGRASRLSRWSRGWAAGGRVRGAAALPGR